jgi:hypothetical protein
VADPDGVSCKKRGHVQLILTIHIGKQLSCIDQDAPVGGLNFDRFSGC